MSGAVFFLIFGATGDLAKRKLFPAIYSLYREKKLTEQFAVVGLARRERTNEQFREELLHSIQEFARYKVEDDADWQRFAQHFEYMSLDINNVEGFRELKQRVDQLDIKYQTEGNRLFYLPSLPSCSEACPTTFATAECLNRKAGTGWSSRSLSGTTWSRPKS